MGNGTSKDGEESAAPRVPAPPSKPSSSKRKNRHGGGGDSEKKPRDRNGDGNGAQFHSVAPNGDNSAPNPLDPTAKTIKPSNGQQQQQQMVDEDKVQRKSLAPNQYKHLLTPAEQHTSQPAQVVVHDDVSKRANFRTVVKRALELAKDQRERFGKFRKDEKRTVMELYEVLGLDDDIFLAPPNELQKRLSNYRFPPPNMHMLRDIEAIDEEMVEFILGAEECKIRKEEGMQVLHRERKVHRDENRRAGVSSEATKMMSKMKVFKEIPKTRDQTERLQMAMKNSMLFRGLDTRDIKTLFDAFEQETFGAETAIFEQGDEGDKFYLVDRGRCHITVLDEGGTQVASVFVGEGDTFGELAVMYGTPRAATVTCVLDTDVWWIDRETYRGTLLNAMVKKRERYLQFLESVPILTSMDSYEKARMADVLEVQDYNRNDAVVREGDDGDEFFIIEEGEVRIDTRKDGEVGRLGAGKFFGELALLFGRPRHATVTVVSPMCRVVMLNRTNFTNYLGPFDEILRRNADQYKHWVTLAQQQ